MAKLDPRLTQGVSEIRPGVLRVVVAGRGNPEVLDDVLTGGFSYVTGRGFLAVGYVDKASLPVLAAKEGVVRVIPDRRLDYNETRLAYEDSKPQTDMFRVRQITGSDTVASTHGIDGKGVRVAVVDTGVDFGNPDLQPALARDSEGLPIALDADEQGLVLTNMTFAANITVTGAVANFSYPLSTHMSPNMTSNVYVTSSGVYLNLSRNGLGINVSYWHGYGVGRQLLHQDYKIGNSPTSFIPSKTGVYHFGLIRNPSYFGVDHPYAALVVAYKSGDRYDTVYVDLSTTYAEWKGTAEPDYNFYDEQPHRVGDGTEYLTADYSGDGIPDISAGLLGAQVLDIWGVITRKRFKVDPQLFLLGVREGVPLPGLSPNGDFFGVMYDFFSHGTLVASSIAGRGEVGYDVYKNGTPLRLPGVASGASIIAAKALWFGDVLYTWMWVSGFDYRPENKSWVYTGRHRADVVSNSWGISEWPILEMGAGYDVISILENALTIPGYLSPNYPGTTFIHAMGNGGPGFGTVTVSASSSLAISVGASTSFHWAKTVSSALPAYGGPSNLADDIIPWSNRGPNALGEPKPDLVNVGAFAFTAAPINVGNGTGAAAYELFGGTSLSTPLTAGGAALVLEAFSKAGSVDVTPADVRTTLMSTAADLGYAPFVQGAGRVDSLAAVSLALSSRGFRVYTEASYANLWEMLGVAWSFWLPWSFYNTTADGFPYAPSRSTSWFAGSVSAGRGETATFTVQNPSPTSLTVQVQPTTLQLVGEGRFENVSDPKAVDPLTQKSSPKYFDLRAMVGPIPAEASLMVVRLTYPFATFYNKTAMEYLYGIPSNLLYLYIYDWDDANKDGAVSYNETSLANYAVGWRNGQEVTVSNPSTKLRHTPLLGVWERGYPWTLNQTVPFTVNVYYYKKAQWGWVSTTPRISIPAESSSTFTATLSVPTSAQPGIFEGFITLIGSNGQVANVPVSVIVPLNADQKGVTYTFGGTAQSSGTMYSNVAVYGSFDWMWRYESGDWRRYAFTVTDSTVNTALLKLVWEDDLTNIDVYILSPYGEVTATTTPPSWYYGLPSNWVPGTGIFFPSKNPGPTSTILAIPISFTGTYTILTHVTLYGGNGDSEPFVGMVELMSIPSGRGVLGIERFILYAVAFFGALALAIFALRRARR